MTLIIDKYDYRLEMVENAVGFELKQLKQALEQNPPKVVNSSMLCSLFYSDKQNYFLMDASNQYTCVGKRIMYQVCSDEIGKYDFIFLCDHEGVVRGSASSKVKTKFARCKIGRKMKIIEENDSILISNKREW